MISSMIQATKILDFARSRTFSLVLSVVSLIVLLAPVIVRAADDESTSYDARVEGYPQKVQLDSGSTALTWLLFVVLGVLTLAVLFKDAKRTHLD
jgi:hypothetical protein